VGAGGVGAPVKNVSPPRNGAGYGPGTQLHHPRHLKSSPKSAYLREGGGTHGQTTEGNQRNHGDQGLHTMTYAKRVIDFDGVRLQQSPVSFDEGVPVSDPSTRSLSTQSTQAPLTVPFSSRKIGFGGDRYEPPSPPSSRDSVAITDSSDDSDDEEDKEHGGALLEAASAYSLAINGQQHGKGKDRVVAKSGKRVTPWVSRASSFCSERPESPIEDDEEDEEEEEEEEGMTTASTTPNPLKQRKLLASPMLEYGNSGNGSGSGRNLLDVGQRYKYANGNFGHDSHNGSHGGASLPVCDPVPAPTDSPIQIIRRMSEETADIFVDAVSTPPPATPAPASPETTFNGNHSIINSLDIPKIQTPPSLLSTPQKLGQRSEGGEARGANGARQFSNASNTTNESHESNTTDTTSTTTSTTSTTSPQNQQNQQIQQCQNPQQTQQTPHTQPHTKPRLTPSDIAATRIVQVTQPTIPPPTIHQSSIPGEPRDPSIPTISEPTPGGPLLPALNLIPATPLALSSKEEVGKQLGFGRPVSRRSTGSGGGGFAAVDEESVGDGGTQVPPAGQTQAAKVEVDGETEKPRRPRLSEIPQRVRESKLHPWWMPKRADAPTVSPAPVSQEGVSREELKRRATTGGIGVKEKNDGRKEKGKVKRINVKGTRFVIEFVGWKRLGEIFRRKKKGKKMQGETVGAGDQRPGMRTRMTA
jgi:hypothetical protein